MDSTLIEDAKFSGNLLLLLREELEQAERMVR